MLWISLGVVGLVGLTGAAAAVYFLVLAEPPPQAKVTPVAKVAPKSPPKKRAPDKVAKEPAPMPDELEKAQTTVAAAPAKKAPETPPAPVTKKVAAEPKAPADAKAQTVPEKSATPAVDLAPLLKSAPLEYAQMTDVLELQAVAATPLLVAVKATLKAETFFELHDLNKPARLAKLKLPKNSQLLDVAPDGSRVVVADTDKRLRLFELPKGTPLYKDDWAPYDDIKDKVRFVGGGKITAVSLLNKGHLLVLTSRNQGDVWDLAKKKVLHHLPPVAREQFHQESAEAGRDFTLSSDRTILAFAGDVGITFHDVKSDKPLGKTPALTKFGPKPELAGMGFEPGASKLGVYLSAGPEKERIHRFVQFKVPGGEEVFSEQLTDAVSPGDFSFVGADRCLAFERRTAQVRDDRGRIVATCGFAGNFGMFAPGTLERKVAFAFLGAKDKVMIGIAEVPTGAGKKGGGKSLAELLTGVRDKSKDQPPEKIQTWEFGARGIVKKGERPADMK